MRSRSLLLVLFLLLTAACNSAVQSVPATQVPALRQTPLATVSATATVGVTATPSSTNMPTQTPTETPTPILPTATFDTFQATSAYLTGSVYYMSTIPLQSLANPVGTPLKSWHAVPILPQATAGQEFNENAYSYKAAATLDQAQQFYANIPKSVGILAPPVAANGINIHYVYFESFDLTIMLASYDNDSGHVIVMIFRIPY